MYKTCVVLRKVSMVFLLLLVVLLVQNISHTQKINYDRKQCVEILKHSLKLTENTTITFHQRVRKGLNKVHNKILVLRFYLP